MNFHYSLQDKTEVIGKDLISIINYLKLRKNKEKIVFLFVGTDSVIGDSYGPLTGSLCKNMNSSNVLFYGDLKNNLNGLNIVKDATILKEKHKNDIIIVIDSKVGNNPNDLYKIMISNAPSFPGRGVNNPTIAIGDISINALVALTGDDLYGRLKNIRLSTVYAFSNKTVEIIDYILKNIS